MAEAGMQEIESSGKPEGDMIMDTKAKAALVVVSVGADRASQLYKYLNEEDIEELTYEVAKLGKTSNSQVEVALDEFYKLCLTHKMMTDGGLDYARNVLEKAFGESTARNLLEKVSKTLQSKPFNFFMKGDPKALLSILQNERPQVIALIMAYMESQQAAGGKAYYGSGKHGPDGPCFSRSHCYCRGGDEAEVRNNYYQRRQHESWWCGLCG